jgi:hypothetical protein
MAWTTPKTWSVGETLTAANFNAHIRDEFNIVNPNNQSFLWPIHKTADQSVTSSTTLIDDTHLQFAIAAQHEYVFELMLAVTGPGFLKVAFNAPSGSAGWWVIEQTISGSRNTATVLTSTFVDGEALGGNTNGDLVWLNGYVDNGATAGTVKLRWAQQTSNGSATILKKGSYLRAYRVA